jgi:predicted component of type VI protein secretion system
MATKTETKPTDSKTETALQTTSTVVHLALDVADKSQSTAIAILQDARTELRAAVDGGIELAEKVATGAFRFAKKVVAKLDDAAKDGLSGTERALATAVKTARETKRELAPAN